MMSSGLPYLQEINIALIALFAFIMWRTTLAPEPVLQQKKKARKRCFDEALDELLEIQSDWYVKVLLEDELNKIVHRARKNLDQEPDDSDYPDEEYESDGSEYGSDESEDDESEYESEYDSNEDSDESEYESEYESDESEYDSEDDSDDESDCATDDQADTPNPPQIKLVDEFDKELEEMLKSDSGEQKVLARRRRRR